jgi:hypothetical protein
VQENLGEALDDGAPDPEITPGSGDPAAPSLWTRLRPELPWAAGVGLLALLMSMTAILVGTTMSALDEQTHMDYAWQISRGEIPAAGDDLSDYVLEEWSCRGQSNMPDLPPCELAAAGDAPTEDYPGHGENYNFFHPPAYYVTAAATGLVGEAVGLEFSTGARLASAAWLMIGMVAVYGALRTWRLPRSWAFSGAALLLAFKPVIASGWQVSNDGPAMLVGAGALWVLGRWALHGRIGPLWPTLVALLAASTKVMSSVGILAVVGLIAVMAVADVRKRDWRTRRPSSRRSRWSARAWPAGPRSSPAAGTRTGSTRCSASARARSSAARSTRWYRRSWTRSASSRARSSPPSSTAGRSPP